MNQFNRIYAVRTLHSFKEVVFADQMYNQTWTSNVYTRLSVENQKFEIIPPLEFTSPGAFLETTTPPSYEEDVEVILN